MTGFRGCRVLGLFGFRATRCSGFRAKGCLGFGVGGGGGLSRPRIHHLVFGSMELPFRLSGGGFGVWGLGCRVQGLRFRVWGHISFLVISLVVPFCWFTALLKGLVFRVGVFRV